MTIFKYDLNTIVRTDHELRKVSAVVDFGKIARKYIELRTLLGRKGYGLAVGIMCLFVTTQVPYSVEPQFLSEICSRRDAEQK